MLHAPSRPRFLAPVLLLPTLRSQTMFVQEFRWPAWEHSVVPAIIVTGSHSVVVLCLLLKVISQLYTNHFPKRRHVIRCKWSSRRLVHDLTHFDLVPRLSPSNSFSLERPVAGAFQCFLNFPRRWCKSRTRRGSCDPLRIQVF